MIHDAQYLASDLPAKRGWGHSTRARAGPRRRGALAWAAAHAPGLATVVAREGLEIDVARLG